MSGICGVFEREGRPLDPELLRRMAACMAFRGPDRQDTWSEGSVGFGHALLRTTEECVAQPLSFDGRTWITADSEVGKSEAKRSFGVVAPRAGSNTSVATKSGSSRRGSVKPSP